LKEKSEKVGKVEKRRHHPTPLNIQEDHPDPDDHKLEDLEIPNRLAAGAN
jgi:hypothetical protein